MPDRPETLDLRAGSDLFETPDPGEPLTFQDRRVRPIRDAARSARGRWAGERVILTGPVYRPATDPARAALVRGVR